MSNQPIQKLSLSSSTNISLHDRYVSLLISILNKKLVMGDLKIWRLEDLKFVGSFY